MKNVTIYAFKNLATKDFINILKNVVLMNCVNANKKKSFRFWP